MGSLPSDGFLENETPFLRSALVFEDKGEEVRVRRGVIVPLHFDNLWACFDPDLLRWVAVWRAPRGKPPISYDSMAAVSYPDKKAKAKKPPQLQGKLLLAFPTLPWAPPPRDERRAHLLGSDLPVGPSEKGQWKGISLSGKTPVLHYNNISETVSAREGFLFERSFSDALVQYPVKGAPRVLKKQAPAHSPPLPIFPQTLIAQNPVKKVSGPYSVSEISFPKSPRAVRATDLAFLSDGTALLATLDGDIWRIEGIEEAESRWTRVATGIFEPISIAVKEDRIYVLGRDQITELIDSNDDHHFDRYRNASDLFQQTIHSRDYATSLEIGSDGSFYLAKGGIVSAKAKGSELENSRHRGAILRITDKRVEVLADGLRLPYVGLRSDGVVFASDQQGNFIPSTPIHMLGTSVPYLGFAPSNHRKEKMLTEPLLYYPYQANRSGAAFATTSAKGFPDLPEQFLHVSWDGRLFSINTPPVGQPFSWQLPLQLDFPSLNGAVHPQSGKLYAVGLGISGYKPTTPELIGLAGIEQAIPYPSPVALDVTEKRVTVKFNRPLAATETIVPGNPTLRLFNVRRTPQYGSGHFLWDGEPGEHQFQPKSYALSADRQVLTLDFDALHRSDLFDLQLIISAGTVSAPVHLYTHPKHLSAASKSDLRALAEAAKNAPKIQPGVADKGQPLFIQYGCIGCHSLVGDKLVGPPLDKAGRFPEDYLRESILKPEAKIAKGYEPSMPSFEGVIPAQDLAHLLSYLQTLQ